MMAMFEVKTVGDQIIEIYGSGEATFENWQEYQQIMIHELHNATQTLYMLSNFSDITLFDSKIAKEVGKAKHLVHPNLGMLVLVGGNVLINFALQLAQNQAKQNDNASHLQVYKDYDQALKFLIFQRDAQANIVPKLI